MAVDYADCLSNKNKILTTSVLQMILKHLMRRLYVSCVWESRLYLHYHYIQIYTDPEGNNCYGPIYLSNRTSIIKLHIIMSQHSRYFSECRLLVHCHYSHAHSHTERSFMWVSHRFLYLKTFLLRSTKRLTLNWIVCITNWSYKTVNKPQNNNE